MRKIVLFIAMSLDGYIADSEGGVQWLEGQGDDSENIDAYSEFIKDIDTILMGRNTYNQLVTELSPNEWIYGDFLTYVFTHKQTASAKNICFTEESPVDLVKKLKNQEGKNIWLCGGANLVNQLQRAGLIDIYYISVIPTLLGKGIRLMEELEKEQKLCLKRTENYNGIVELIYEKR